MQQDSQLIFCGVCARNGGADAGNQIQRAAGAMQFLFFECLERVCGKTGTVDAVVSPGQ